MYVIFRVSKFSDVLIMSNFKQEEEVEPGGLKTNSTCQMLEEKYETGIPEKSSALSEGLCKCHEH